MPITPAAAEFAESSAALANQDLEAVQARCAKRAGRMLADLKRVNEAQFQLVVDPNAYVAGLCPRRSGKTYAGAAAALITGEAKPGSIVVVISLTLKALRRTWWFGAASGIPTLARQYGIPLTYNSTELRWEHENGSIGYLLGAETREQMEYLRGMEADLYIIDECKSFSAAVLAELLDDILEPQRNTRRGRIMMIGTPGAVAKGPFYEATEPLWRDEKTNLPGCIEFGQPVPEGHTLREFVSLHRWTLKDNKARPHQWDEAMLHKAKKRWADNHPTWRREYLGEWTPDMEGIVYAYIAAQLAGVDVNWEPFRSDHNPTGLPPERGPWHIVMGLDLGYEDPTALVVAAWSETVQELRHVFDIKMPHLLPDDVALLINRTIARFGKPEIMFADTSNLSRMLVEGLRQRFAFPIEAAERREKYDFIELINADFKAGRIKIIAKTDLEAQLSSVQWDLEKGDRAELAHIGKLREDPKCPNDLTDSLLYLYRGCLHYFARAVEKGPEYGTPEYWAKWENDCLAKARRDLKTTALNRANMIDRCRGPMLVDAPYGRTPPPPPKRGNR